MATVPRPLGLLLDLGGTILTEKRSDAVAGFDHLIAHARSERRIARDPIREDFRGLMENVQRVRHDSRVEVPIRTLLRLLCDRYGLEFAIDEGELEWEFWREAMWCIPEAGVVDAVTEAAHRDLPVAVVSNTMFRGETLERELKIHGLQDCFRFVITSADYGFRKPDPRLFLAAAGRLNLPPQRLWMIGDSLEMDTAGAQAAGMTGVWYNPAKRVEVGVIPDLVLNGWPGLAALLDRVD